MSEAETTTHSDTTVAGDTGSVSTDGVTATGPTAAATEGEGDASSTGSDAGGTTVASSGSSGDTDTNAETSSGTTSSTSSTGGDPEDCDALYARMARVFDVDDASEGLVPNGNVSFVSGRHGQAARIPGGSSDIGCDLGDCNDLRYPGGPMIWWSWVRRDEVVGNDRCLDAQTSATPEVGSGYSLQLRSMSPPANMLDFAAYMGAIRRAQTFDPYPLGEWHFLTAVYRFDWNTVDAAMPSGGLVRVFIDGVDQTADTVCVKDPLNSPIRCIDWGSEPFDLPTATTPGRFSLGYGGRFNGAIDRTGVGFGVFGPQDVAALYACEMS